MHFLRTRLRPMLRVETVVLVVIAWLVATLNSAMSKVLDDPAVRAKFTELGLDVASKEQQTPEGLAAFQKAEIEKWWPIIKASGITPE